MFDDLDKFYKTTGAYPTLNFIQEQTEKVISEMKEQIEEYVTQCLFSLDIDKDVLMKQTLEIQRLNNELEKCRWIPVTERLPEEGLNSVIGWDDYRERCVFVCYLNGYWQIPGRVESFNILAWMPLPQPYKKEGGMNE